MNLLANPVITLVIELIVLGVASWLVTSAPFIDEPFKGFVKWVIIAVAVILVVVFLFGLFGVTL